VRVGRRIHPRSAVLLALVVWATAAFAGPSGPAAARAAEAADPVAPDAVSAEVVDSIARTDRLIVRWEQKVTPASAKAQTRLAELGHAAGGEARFHRFTGSGATVYELDRPLGDDAPAIVAAVEALPGVASAEPDRWFTVDALPNDPLASSLWGLLGPSDGSPYGIDAVSAWPTSTGEDVVVAVIDTGLVAHPDLAGQTVAGYDFIGGPHGNDGNGRDADPSDPGDWCNPDPSSWHGTHVAGTIAAIANNSTGVFGGAPDVAIQAVRVLGQCGGYETDIADGIRWAAGGTVPGVLANATPARVLNISLGGEAPTCLAEFASAIDDARSRGSVVVVAAGNRNEPAAGATPANCPGVITVAATDSEGRRGSFSNYGGAVELAAPGVSIRSTIDSGLTGPTGATYAYYNGTSMAAPHVAAAAALVIAARPAITPDEVALLLRDTATPVGAASGGSSCQVLGCGSGIVNAARAVAALTDGVPPTVSIAGAPSPAKAGPTFTLTFSEPVTGLTAADFTKSGTAAAACTVKPPTGSARKWSVGTTCTSSGTIKLTLAADAVADVSGMSGPLSAVDTATIIVDLVAPSASAPKPSLRAGAKLSGASMPIKVSWSGADAGGAGLARYELARSTNGGSYATVGISYSVPYAYTTAGGGTHRFRVRAIDAAGNVGPWVYGSTTRASLVQQTSTAIRYIGSWTTVRNSVYSGSSVRAASRLWSNATYTFTGRSVALVTTKATTRGKARVYVDGKLATTIDLRASAAHRVLVYAKTWSSSSKHTIRIVVLATAGRPRVDIDAFATLR